MHDPVDIRRRTERLVARVRGRDDYGQLLACGQVIHQIEDADNVEGWRAAIRRQARADRIKVRTGVNDNIVWALRIRRNEAEWQADVRRFRDLLSRTVPMAVALHHEPSITIRDGDEVICDCGRCSALGYCDVAAGIVGGALFEDECPNEEPPKLTALVMMYVPGSLWPSRR